MSQHKPAVTSEFETLHISLRSYSVAFVSCVVLTLLAYLVATDHSINNRSAIGLIAALAVVQLYIQLRKFLHLGDEQRPRWRLLAFITMVIIVAIFVGGSLWIMNNLNYRMIYDPAAQNRYVQSQDGL